MDTLETIAARNLAHIIMLCKREENTYASDQEYSKLRKEIWLKRFYQRAREARSNPAPSISFGGLRAGSAHGKITAPVRNSVSQTSQAMIHTSQLLVVRGQQRSQSTLQRVQPDDRIDSNWDENDLLNHFLKNEPKFQCMAKTCAYFGLAISRIADNITMHIRDDFISSLSIEIETNLKKKLKEIGETDLKRFAADDPADVSHRESLNTRKLILTSAIDYFLELQK